MKKLLLIEDDVALLWLISRIVSNQYEVVKVRNAQEALLALQNGYKADLILTDLGLPVVDGLDLLQYLKQSGLYYHIPVIVLSGNENPKVIAQCLGAGAAKFILKPFDPPRLLSDINNVLSADYQPASALTADQEELVLVER
jgi:two-component system, chemotaxis family, chemotaxis protein CheY